MNESKNRNSLAVYKSDSERRTEAARLLGRIKTADKARASRENGLLGGRPRKHNSPTIKQDKKQDIHKQAEK